ncbi:hypothetical protein [Paracoccus sediminicola]|uniref:hypothetical protein n=1 Tax=Paracoccus sediminicola TaxID=3017783 RepID=UPI0022F122C1|nr:hypothetical protein [Paracoccus sediminicola]WBU55516.1 hypothetical protein PAF18_08220 [Paracoccus sediminicola]
MSQRRRLILHVGQTKAGSTSIQNYLESQREALRGHAVLFPKSGMARQNPYDQDRTPGHLRLLSQIRTGDTSEFESELAQDQNATVLLSVENIFSDVPEKTLLAAAEYFEDWDVEIIAVLRSQQDWLRSRYTENIMSGFRSSPMTLAAFVDESLSRGFLNYPKRLRELGTIFNAEKLRAIVFDHHEKPLVLRFLDELGLPVTDPDLAAAMHANQREKSHQLVETKRVLNLLLQDGCSVADRLEIEHLMRLSGKRLLSEVTAQPIRIELSEHHLDIIEAGNRQLVDEGIMDDPITGGSTQPARAVAQHDMQSDQTEELFFESLCHASDVIARAEQKPEFSPLNFAAGDLGALRSALADRNLTVHVDSADIAMLCACQRNCLVVLLLSGEDAAYAMQKRIDRLHWPARFVAMPMELFDELRSALESVGLESPDLVSFGPEVTVATGARVVDALAPDRIILRGATMDHVIAQKDTPCGDGTDKLLIVDAHQQEFALAKLFSTPENFEG